MSDQITSNDRGVVQGDTWHRKEEYIRQETPVTIDQCKHVFDYELQIVGLELPWTDPDTGVIRRYKVEGANCIVRPDINEVLVPHVGDRFRLLDAETFIDSVDLGLLQKYDDLHIESCGTLYSGQIRFISIVLDEYHVAGDDSQTLDRILFTDPIGEGAYTSCMNQTRVVCDNTRRIANSQGKKNLSYTSVSHTEGGENRIKQSLLDIAEVRLGLHEERERMDYFANTQMSVADVTAFLEFLYPLHHEDGSAKEGRSFTIARNKQQAVLGIFESGQTGLQDGYTRTAYALFNALTDYLGNQEGREGFDVDLDNLNGTRADTKDEALQYLMGVCREKNGI